jgi:signal transduction histidine kinase
MARADNISMQRGASSWAATRDSSAFDNGIEVRRVHRLILRVYVVAAGLAAMAMAVAGLVTGDPQSLLVRSLFSGVLASYAAWRLWRDQSATPIFYLTLFVIVAAMFARGSSEAISSGTLGVVGISLALALLTTGRRHLIVFAAIATTAVTAARSQIVDESAIDLIGSAVIVLIVVMFGAQLIEWAKQEISGRQRSFENLFDHVPVAIWEEDFTAVAAWLDGLRARGVVDLRAHFEADPAAVVHGASLINVTNVNRETMRFLEVEDRDSILGPLDPSLIVEGSLVAMIEELVAVWEESPQLRVDLTGANTIGQPIEGYLLMAAPETPVGIDWSRVVVAIVDVSVQRATQRRLEELIDSKDQFVASVSHELRTPLTAVIGLAEELRADTGTVSDAERDELLSLIADQAIEVSHIVEDLLVAAQANIGRVTIHPEVVEVNREFVSLLATMGQAVKPSLEIESDTVVAADPRRLRQILRNLITNADRYGRGLISVHAFSEGPSTIVEVCDDGDGIPEELRERVFEPYETAHRAIGVTGSMGLGLTVSRELARLMGGDLTYVRRDGLTVFRLSMPAPADHIRMVS